MNIQTDYFPKPIEYKIQKYEHQNTKNIAYFNMLSKSKNILFLLLWKLSELYEQNPNIVFILSLYLPFSSPQIIKLCILFGYIRRFSKYYKYVNFRSRFMLKIANVINNIYLNTKKEKKIKTYDVEEKATFKNDVTLTFLDDYC